MQEPAKRQGGARAERTLQREGMTSDGSALRVVVAGANGRMGRTLVEGLPEQGDIDVVGTITRENLADTERVLAGADVMVEFTHPDVGRELILRAIDVGVRPVSGTTGLPDDAFDEIDAAATARRIGAVWAVNYRIGGAVLAALARLTAKHLEPVEIVEIMHATKKDAPSGVSLALARAISESRGSERPARPAQRQVLPGTRGGETGGVHIHSVRIPGLLTRTEVYFGGTEEIIVLQHEESGRSGYPATVARAIRKVMEPDVVGLIRTFGAVIGLE
jgi:4-hydroxy-tetrahydrodipicolinate reductase